MLCKVVVPIFEGFGHLDSFCVFVIKYDHNTYDRRTRKIPSEDTIGLLPEEKANSCQRDSECWRVPGACT